MRGSAPILTCAVVCLAACGETHGRGDAGAVRIDAGADTRDAGALPASLVVRPDGADFGVSCPDTATAVSFTVSNGGGAPSGPVSTSIMSGDARAFAIDTDGCRGRSLAAGASCAITVRLAPSPPGVYAAWLAVSATPGTTVRAELSANVAADCGEGVLTLAPTPFDFGTVVVGGSSATVDFTVTNAGGGPGLMGPSSLEGVDATQFEIVSDGCVGVTLSPGAACVVSVRFVPTAPGESAATLSAGVAGGASVSAAILGTGREPEDAFLVASPSSIDFGLCPATDTRTVTITNGGDAPTGSITVSLAGPDASQFAIVSNLCTGLLLVPGEPCTIEVAYRPTSPGAHAAVLEVSTLGRTTGVDLAGAWAADCGAGTFTAVPSPYDFGTVAVGAMSSSVDFTLTNTGGSPSGTGSTSLGGASPGDFEITSDTCDDGPIPAGGSCTISVRFVPAASGARTATLRFSASPGGVATTTLTGTGA